MAKTSTSYLRKAYKAAQRELNDLLAQQQKLEKRLVIVRQNLQSLASVCQSEGIAIEPSGDASYLLTKSALGDEIRRILTANYPAWSRPNQIRNELERIGHDLSKYSNPQATIQMVLKRMAESGEAQEAIWPEDGKKIYRIPRHPSDVQKPYRITLADTAPRLVPLSSLAGPLDPAKFPENLAAYLRASNKK